jgi:hypothetical protein
MKETALLEQWRETWRALGVPADDALLASLLARYS